jgi:CHRD domain
MKKLIIATSVLAIGVLVVLGTALAKHRDDNGGQFFAFLNGYQETPSISTTGRGTFVARRTGPNELRYRLRWSNLEGGAVSGAHIHLGQRHVAGGIVVFLCGGGTKPPATFPCDGDVEGTIVPADVQALTAQGIAAGEFDEVLRAMRAGATYANVHTATFPGGEIRGQIHHGNHFRKHGRKHDDD